LDVDFSACGLNQFREGVEVAACAVVVDRYDRIVLAFGKCTDDIRYAFLHFGIGALHGVKLDRVAVLAGRYR
jgi:hypothetical protein